MKMLFLRQPWASLVALELKPKESRYWQKNCSYRGDVLIVASKKPDSLKTVRSIMTPEQFKRFQQLQKDSPIDLFGQSSTALCVANMVDYRPMNPDDEPGSWVAYNSALKILDLKDIRKVEPFIIFPGMLGLLDVPPQYLELIKY